MNWESLYNSTRTRVELIYDTLYDYVDLYFLEWLAWVLYPLVITFILPIVIFILVYASSVFLHLYRIRHILKDSLKDAIERRDFWDGARGILGVFWDAHGWIWHGLSLFLFLV